jgi:hypothetical protein
MTFGLKIRGLALKQSCMNISIAIVTPEEIVKIYTSLTLEEVYATILYYLHNKEAVSKYIADWLNWGHQQRKAQALNPHPAAARLQKLRDEREAMKKVNGTQISHV